MIVKSLAFSMTALLFVGAQAVAQTPATSSAPVTPAAPVADTAPPTKDSTPVKVAKADEPVCRYVAIDGSKVRKRICN